MRSIQFNTTIASAFGAASAKGTSLPCSNFFRKFCDTTGKEPNHKINKAKTENWRLRKKTVQNRYVSDRPKGLKNNHKILFTSFIKKILSSHWRGLSQAYALLTWQTKMRLARSIQPILRPDFRHRAQGFCLKPMRQNRFDKFQNRIHLKRRHWNNSYFS